MGLRRSNTNDVIAAYLYLSTGKAGFGSGTLEPMGAAEDFAGGRYRAYAAFGKGAPLWLTREWSRIALLVADLCETSRGAVGVRTSQEGAKAGPFGQL